LEAWYNDRCTDRKYHAGNFDHIYSVQRRSDLPHYLIPTFLKSAAAVKSYQNTQDFPAAQARPVVGDKAKGAVSGFWSTYKPII
jgi:hypothetical protein